MPDAAGIHPMPLDVLIVGGGLGGAAAAVALCLAGCRVTVLESAPQLSEIGAGVQMSPNATRLLRRWGLNQALQSSAVAPQQCSFRRWQDGSVLGRTLLNPKMQEDFDSPYWVLHRAHLLECLHARAVELGATTILNARVVGLELETCTVTTFNGARYSADVILGCDGIKSILRSHLLPHPDPGPQATGFACYRATVSMDILQQDPETAELVRRPDLNIWIGDGRHVMTYPIAGGKTFNLVLSHPDDGTKTSAGVEEEMRQNYRGWDPVLQRVLREVRNPTKWQLQDYATDMEWVHPTANIALMGDAVHAMLPYMSQGAAQAIEDAAVLAQCLGSVTSKDGVHSALRIYETIRKPRAKEVQTRSSLNGRIWHYPDGREQQARDRGMHASLSGEQFLRSTNQWSDPRVQLWLYAHDAEASAKEVLDRLPTNAVEAAVSNRKGAANGHGNTSSHIDEMIAWGLLSSSNA